MATTSLYALTALDGRYTNQTQVLSPFFSESSLIFHRIKTEIIFLQKLAKFGICRKLTSKERKILNSFYQSDDQTALKIKQIEQQTHHDVKAVEYFLQKKFKSTSLEDLIPFIHFGLTSEDVNNLSYRQMTDEALEQILKPKLIEVIKSLVTLSDKYADLPMLARTHGQAAIPTTLGKEISVFAFRLFEQLKRLDQFKLTGKLNGAVGGYNSFYFAKPQVNWLKLSKELIAELDLRWQLNTTQINQADDLVELFSIFHLVNSILIDLSQDIWRYISDDYLLQKGKQDFVGSSTMPQKINPIEFENSEGNLVMANGLYETFNRKLPISRLQRDLSDSTVMRNIGVAFGYNLVAFNSLIRGLNTIEANRQVISQTLNHNWNILAEAINVKLRLQNNSLGYEQAAAAMKGKQIDQQKWRQITFALDPSLANLTPEKYLGKTVFITKQTTKSIKNYLLKKEST